MITEATGDAEGVVWDGREFGHLEPTRLIGFVVDCGLFL